MNLYSSKQKWKIALLILALGLVAVSFFVTNAIVAKIGERERARVEQWADAIQQKLELVRLTNRTFSQLRDRERREMQLWVDATKEISKESPLDQIPDFSFPLKIIDENKDIPVILMDNEDNISGSRNIDLDTSVFMRKSPSFKSKDLQGIIDDSLRKLAKKWVKNEKFFNVEVFEGLTMTYAYNDSRELVRLEKERDSLIQAFNRELIENEELVPVILVDELSNNIIGTNLSDKEIAKTGKVELINQLKQQNEPIIIDFKSGSRNILYFDDSPELKQLQYYPYIVFFIVGLFVLIGYLVFSTFRRAEQNQVWAGMAKETAHQLGTPLSSLMAWIQLLESQDVDSSIIKEMQKDVDRLEKVTDRFSKIGSSTILKPSDINATVEGVLDYLRPRISQQIVIKMESKREQIVKHNGPLIEWVVENIAKNAVDAMENKGVLDVIVHDVKDWVYIDISDTGKGIAANQFKTIFKPGFSTKKRGWGLGLSLVKRIINEYHKGKVYVLQSESNVRTTFRIALPKK
jgi:signal transduction histidine kinase